MSLYQLLDLTINSLSLASIIFFSSLFLLRSFASPSAAAAAPLQPQPQQPQQKTSLPSISTKQADSNLDSQLSHLIASQNSINSAINAISTPPPTKAPKSKAKSAPKTLKPAHSIKALTPSPLTLNAQQLRALCSQHNIKWRNALGKNKHLSSTQMKTALKNKGVTF